MTRHRLTAERTDRAGEARAVGVGLALVRIVFGLIFLSNAIAKVTGVSRVQLGPLNGTLITQSGARGILERAVDGTWLPALASVYRDVVLANWSAFALALTIAELAIGVGLIVGLLSRLAAAGALLLIGPIWLLVLSQGGYLWDYPIELLILAVLAVVPSGRVLGLDRRLATRWPRWPV